MRYKSLVLICIHQSSGQSIEFVKLAMLIVFAQYLTRFNITAIEQFVAQESQAKKREEENGLPPVADQKAWSLSRESALLQFKIFEELSLDEIVQELYSKIEPLYYLKDLQNLAKVKLQAVLLCTVKSRQVLFNYSFCYVSLKKIC